VGPQLVERGQCRSGFRRCLGRPRPISQRPVTRATTDPLPPPPASSRPRSTLAISTAPAASCRWTSPRPPLSPRARPRATTVPKAERHPRRSNACCTSTTRCSTRFARSASAAPSSRLHCCERPAAPSTRVRRRCQRETLCAACRSTLPTRAMETSRSPSSRAARPSARGSTPRSARCVPGHCYQQTAKTFFPPSRHRSAGRRRSPRAGPSPVARHPARAHVARAAGRAPRRRGGAPRAAHPKRWGPSPAP